MNRIQLSKFIGVQQTKRLAVALAFGTVGVIFLFLTHASTPALNLEAEGGSNSPAIKALPDTTGSSGNAIKFGGGGVLVPNSIASDCSVDVTSSLLTWLSGEPDNITVSFGSNKCYRIDGTIELRGRSNMVFEANGSTFKSVAPMTTGSSTDDQRAMWRFIGSTNISFINMKIVGSYTHGGTFDATLQHAHGLDFRGTSATVRNVQVSNVAGDCVYLGLGYDNTTRSTGSVTNSSCTGTGRNGISVTAANNVQLNTNTLDKIGYTTFDLEPNVGAYTATTGWGTSNITVSGNAIGSYYLYAFAIVENSSNSTDTFTNNTVTGPSGLRVGVVAPGSTVVRASNVTITNNTTSVTTWSPAMEFQNIDGLTVTGNRAPTGGTSMATVDNSCSVNVSGNTFTGATREVTITNTPAGC